MDQEKRKEIDPAVEATEDWVTEVYNAILLKEQESLALITKLAKEEEGEVTWTQGTPKGRQVTQFVRTPYKPAVDVMEILREMGLATPKGQQTKVESSSLSRVLKQIFSPGGRKAPPRTPISRRKGEEKFDSEEESEEVSENTAKLQTTPAIQRLVKLVNGWQEKSGTPIPSRKLSFGEESSGELYTPVKKGVERELLGGSSEEGEESENEELKNSSASRVNL